MGSVPFGFRQQSEDRWAGPLARSWSEWFEVLSPGGTESLDPPIHVRIGVAEDGRLVSTGLLVGGMEEPRKGAPGQELTARQAHEVPLGQIVSSLATYMAGAVGGSSLEKALTKGIAQSMVHGPKPRPRTRPGPKGHSLEFYEGVAEDYRRALIEAPHAPMVWLAEGRNYSRVQMARLVREARRVGVLGPAPKGRAGEGPTDMKEKRR